MIYFCVIRILKRHFLSRWLEIVLNGSETWEMHFCSCVVYSYISFSTFFILVEEYLGLIDRIIYRIKGVFCVVQYSLVLLHCSESFSSFNNQTIQVVYLEIWPLHKSCLVQFNNDILIFQYFLGCLPRVVYVGGGDPTPVKDQLKIV